jgi:hypothetical protein
MHGARVPALLFLRANSLEAKPETSESNMHEKAQETELRQWAVPKVKPFARGASCYQSC